MRSKTARMNPARISPFRLTRKIVLRDNARTGKKYYAALRGYQQRKDILEAMYRSLDEKKLGGLEPKIIDLGCGPGIVGHYFFKKFGKKRRPAITFVDINPLMLRAIRRRKNFRVLQQDVTDLKLKAGSFDVSVMKQVLDYLPKELQLKTLKNACRVLRRGGQFVISALVQPPNAAIGLTNYLYSEREKTLNPNAPVQKFIPNRETLIRWLSMAGFKEIEVKYAYGIPLSVKDFVGSFGLNQQQKNRLVEIYKKIIQNDRSNAFKAKTKKGDIELVERGIIISCSK